mgnify:CR=1 FL=1
MGRLRRIIVVALLAGLPASAQTFPIQINASHPGRVMVRVQGQSSDFQEISSTVPAVFQAKPGERVDIRVAGRGSWWADWTGEQQGCTGPSNVTVRLEKTPAWKRLSALAGLLGLAGLLAAFGRKLVARRADRALAAVLRGRQQLLESVGAEYERILGRWLIVGKIGSGGMGEVLRAFPADDVRMDSMGAIKLRAKFDQAQATKDLSDREKDERARFAIETKVLCTLKHPGIVKVYDWGEIDGRDYYAMELVQGENLQSYLERHPRLSYREVRDLFAQALTVVGFAHDQGVLHRDLKPLNILREPNGRLKVIDFGLARDQNQTVAYTQVGMPFAGSLEYMDPRVAMQMFGKITPTPSDQGTDQFALGGILFLMLTGRPSIELPEELDAQGLLPVLTKIAEARPSPRTYRPDLPEELEKVVMTMQAVNVEDRYTSLDEAKEVFVQAIARHVESE